MPHVSKDKLNPKLLKLIFAELSLLIARSDKKSAPRFLHSLLTETEQIMIAKRLAVVVMLSQEKGMYRIATRLNLSTSTVKRISLAYDEGDYDGIVSAIAKNKKDAERFWELVDLIARAGMPSMGKDRWKSLR